MTDLTLIRHRTTGGIYPIPSNTVDPALHEVHDGPARDANGNPVAPTQGTPDPTPTVQGAPKPAAPKEK